MFYRTLVVRRDQMNVLNIDHFISASSFSRSYSSTSGGSCIVTGNTVQTKEVNYLSGLGSEKVLKFLRLNCLTVVPFCPLCIGHQIGTFMNLYVNWSY